jgi:hypothetical protein
LQYILKYKYKYDLGNYGPNGDGVDGSFGLSTQNAVIAFPWSQPPLAGWVRQRPLGCQGFEGM